MTAPETHTFLFLDLAGYTALTEAMGDEEAAAIRLALAVVNEVGGRHFFPTVRAGMHTGPAVERDGDWFGSTVNIAARISGLAGGGEVLLTEATRDVARDLEGIELIARGTRQLRNVVDPIAIFAAAARTGATPELPIDPVCHMAVDPSKAAGRLVHEGREYCFCSLECVQRFASSPETYVRA